MNLYRLELTLAICSLGAVAVGGTLLLVALLMVEPDNQNLRKAVHRAGSHVILFSMLCTIMLTVLHC